MRSVSMPSGTTDQLLTTGEAARVLGTSRQHVVNLTKRGDLPYETTGTHRRVRLSDVDRVRYSTQRLSADQRRSLHLAYAIAGKLVQDPALVDVARQNLERMRARHTRGRPAQWLAQWQELLDGPLDELLIVLTSPSQRSRELRQNSPFAGVLTDDERRAALAATR
ncbi:helix-turn-helix domain-containing protein [Cellulomonas xiejunii]|uniref:Helix-turn-helix domain-containing protein n=1 Tax=Cellulomonas xiejunii TaxID=2968083 RepID=A0ABY5KVC1_9CELL|nr:helix-turn-helix domain-containing protein [Cellulomonas xiejunii]MCC2322225.1 helix-turn-helix domain-containing protein [Cellulomonas xiejunii]UUI72278.1 helix-turn-helix domain-containing protein [Cellulomonas xiejunii]